MCVDRGFDAFRFYDPSESCSLSFEEFFFHLYLHASVFLSSVLLIITPFFYLLKEKLWWIFFSLGIEDINSFCFL